MGAMASINAERLKVLITFLQDDKLGADYRNVERAAADFLANNFTLVQGIADRYDETDVQMQYDKEHPV